MSSESEEKPDNVVPVTAFSTEDGGKPSSTVDDGGLSDIATSALANARRSAGHQAQVRETQAAERDARRRASNRRANSRQAAQYSGSRPDERDPQLVGMVVDNLFATRGWNTKLAQARIFSDWAGLVGDDVAQHSTPVSIDEGKLQISAESTAWATQLRMMASQILARLVKELGPTIVTGLHITGPVAPSWKRGGWSVRGRGPRDTYG